MKQYTGTGYTIYKHTNKVNGKVYIGQTKCTDLTRRWSGGHGYKQCRYFKSAIDKYGWSAFSHEILETGLSKNEANEAEIRYIRLYNSTDPTCGYNISEGGSVHTAFSPEGMASLREKFSGANSHSARSVSVFDLEGNRVADFQTASDAAKYLGVGLARMVTVCQQMTGTCANHICHYTENVEGLARLPQKMLYKPNEQRSHLVPVAMYDLNGTLLRVFDSVTDASEATGITRSMISACITQHQVSAGGYLWRYVLDTPNLFIDSLGKETPKGERSVRQYDIHTGELLNEFPSLAKAAESVETALAVIHSAANNPKHTAKGYLWRYASEKLDRVEPHHPYKDRKWRTKKVAQYDIQTGELLAVFDSIACAAKNVGCGASSISGHLHGRLKHAGGFIWKCYENDGIV